MHRIGPLQQVEIRLGNDLEFHPGNFTEHGGKFPVELDDKEAICIAKSGSEIDASRVETSAIVEILPMVMFKRVVGFAIEVYAVVMIAFVLTLAVTMLMMLAVMVIFALVVVAFNNQEEAIEITVEVR
jgi:hypothetical protein